MSDHCVFCRIIRGELSGSVVYQDDQVYALMDLNQAAPGHLLVLPRPHLERLVELDEQTAGALMACATRLTRAVYRALQADGVNLLINDGAAAGQDVFHLHLHIIPRWQSDGHRGGWPIRRADKAELETRAEQIRQALAVI